MESPNLTRNENLDFGRTGDETLRNVYRFTNGQRPGPAAPASALPGEQPGISGAPGAPVENVARDHPDPTVRAMGDQLSQILSAIRGQNPGGAGGGFGMHPGWMIHPGWSQGPGGGYGASGGVPGPLGNVPAAARQPETPAELKSVQETIDDLKRRLGVVEQQRTTVENNPLNKHIDEGFALLKKDKGWFRRAIGGVFLLAAASTAIALLTPGVAAAVPFLPYLTSLLTSTGLVSTSIASGIVSGAGTGLGLGGLMNAWKVRKAAKRLRQEYGQNTKIEGKGWKFTKMTATSTALGATIGGLLQVPIPGLGKTGAAYIQEGAKWGVDGLRGTDIWKSSSEWITNIWTSVTGPKTMEACAFAPTAAPHTLTVEKCIEAGNNKIVSLMGSNDALATIIGQQDALINKQAGDISALNDKLNAIPQGPPGPQGPQGLRGFPGDPAIPGPVAPPAAPPSTAPAFPPPSIESTPRGVGEYVVDRWQNRIPDSMISISPDPSKAVTLSNAFYNFGLDTPGTDQFNKRFAAWLDASLDPANRTGFRASNIEATLKAMGNVENPNTGVLSKDFWLDGKIIKVKGALGDLNYIRDAIGWIDAHGAQFGYDSITAKEKLAQMHAKATGQSLGVVRRILRM